SIRAFAQEKLEASSPAFDRHTAYYLGVATAWAERAAEFNDAECLRRLELEVENLLTVHRRARAPDARAGDAARAMLALHPVVSSRGPSDVQLALLDATVDASTDTGALLGRILIARSKARMLLGALEGSRADAERALAIGRREGDGWIEGKALGVLG